MDNTKLIESLSLDLKPVTVLRYTTRDYLITVAIGFFSVLAGLAVSGLRVDILTVLASPRFILETFILLILALASSVAALQMSLPNLNHTKLKWILATTLLLWLASITYFYFQSNSPIVSQGFSCSKEIFFVSLFSTLFIYFFTKKSAPLYRSTLGWIILTSGAAYGAIATQFSCSVSEPFHLLAWHALPVLIIGFMGLGLGKIFFNKL